MAELEKVIRGLRDIDMFIAGRLEHEKAKNFLRTIDETITLLKEQEAVVRCKDCKFGSPISERGLDFIFCHFRENKHQYATHGGCFEPDWFCADGERR